MVNNKLRIWLITTSNDPARLSYLYDRFSRFEKTNNVKIKLENLTWERIFTALVEGFKHNNAPDVLQIGTSWVRIFSYMGYLDQVPDSFRIKPSINGGINKICRYKGKEYAVPWMVDTVIMAGRKDYMEKLGIKESDVGDWEGLIEVGRELRKMKNKNINMPVFLSVALQAERDTLHRFCSILWSRGWEFPDLEKIPEKILTDSLMLDTIKYFAELKMSCDNNIKDIDKHPYQVNEDFYLNGLSVFYLGSWYGIVEKINKNDQKDSSDMYYSLLPFPTSTGQSCSYGGGSVLGVSSRSKNKEKAWKLVEYLISDDFMRKWVDNIDYVPAFEDEFWEKRVKDERISLMYEQTINSNIYPPHPAWMAIENELIKGVYYTIRELIRKGSTEISENAFSFLKEIDGNIKNILELCWEMSQNDCK